LNWRSSKPLRETPSASHIRFTGQAPRCFATKPNFTSTPWRRRPRLFSGYRAPSELGNLLAQPLYLGLLGLPSRPCRETPAASLAVSSRNLGPTMRANRL
jgi:hypothetical protein